MHGARSAIAGLLAAGLALAAAGCILGTETMGSGESTRVWRGGKLSKTYQADYEKVWKAASGAVHEMQLAVESELHDALVGRIKARRADDIVVRVDLDNVGAKQARLTIWVGAIGTERDKLCAMTLMDTVDKRLGK